MLKVLSDCENCFFLKEENGVQVGCHLNILDNIENKKLVNDKFYSFDKICMFFRSKDEPDWKYKTLEQGIELVNREMEFFRTGLVINFIKNHSLSALKETLDSIDNPSYIIVINDKPEYNKEIFEIIKLKISDLKRLHIVQIINQKEEYYLDEAFKFCRLGTFCYADCGAILPSNLNKKIVDFVFRKMNKLAYCDCGDYKLYSAKLFKVAGGNKQKLKEDGTIDSKNYLQRLQEQETNESKLIFTKEEFLNADINNNS